MPDDTQVTYLVIDASKAVEGGRAAQRALENLEKQGATAIGMLGQMEKALGGVALSLKAHLVLALTEAAARIGDLVRESFNAVSGLAEMAEQMGTNARALQAMQFAAVQGGAKLETLEGAIGKFSVKLGEAAEGSKTVIDALKSLGVHNLDAAGNLRATEDVIQDVAEAILKIEDPARRASAMVEFFGKSGRQLIPILKDLASGADAMAAVAEANKAMISDETIEKLDKYADNMEKAKLKMRAMSADGLAWMLDKAHDFDAWMDGNIKKLHEWQASLDIAGPVDKARRWLDDLVLAGGAFVINFIEFFKAVPSAIAKSISDGINEALAALGSGLTKMNSAIIEKMPWLARQLNMKGGDISLGRVDFGSDSKLFTGDTTPGQMWAAGQKIQYGLKYGAEADARAREQARIAEQKAIEAHQKFWEMDTSGTKPTSPLNSGGGWSAVKDGGGGNDPGKKFEKLRDQLRAAAAAQDEMTAAAMRGDLAISDLRIKTEAQAKATEIFGHALADNDPRLKELVTLMERLAKGKAAEAFAQGTNELKNQNEILAKQLELMDEEPVVQARALAAMKAKHDAQKSGLDLEGEAYKARLAAMEQNEKLKLQQEQLRRSQELWTEPLKTAFKDIQRAGADAWDAILKSGQISFSSLSDVFKTTIRRMIAEFLQLATIRPIMQVVVQGMNSMGLVSNSTMSQMGYSPSTGGGGSMFSGLGGLTMPSWLGGGQPFSFLNQPMFGGAAASPAAMYGAPSGAAGLTGGGLSWGAGLGALAGAGMGVYQLLSGGGSTSSTIGGISSIVGAGLSLIPGIGPFLGAGVGILGNMLPGLFGMDKPPVITNQTYGQLTYGQNGWYTTGGAWGPSANASGTQAGLQSLGGGISAVFDLLGGVKDPSKVWGLAAMNKTVSGKDWSSSSDSLYLVDPNGNQQLWRMNEGNMMDTGSAQVAYRSILEGAMGEISERMRMSVTKTGQTMGGTSLQAIADIVVAVKNFEKALESLGKTTTNAEKTFAELDNSLGGMWQFAKDQGYSSSDITSIEAFKETERVRYAREFMDQFANKTPYERELEALRKQKESTLSEAEYLQANLNTRPDLLGVRGLEAYYIDMNQITEYYLQQEAELKKKYMEQSVSDLAGVIKELTMGEAAALSPADAVGMYGDNYRNLLARASTDASARAELGGAATSYLNVLKDAYGSTAIYHNARRGVLADLAGVTLDTGDASSVEAVKAMAPLVNALMQQIQVLLAQVAGNADAAAARDAEIARLSALVQRLVSNQQPG